MHIHAVLLLKQYLNKFSKFLTLADKKRGGLMIYPGGTMGVPNDLGSLGTSLFTVL